jgi:hypothetical protein
MSEQQITIQAALDDMKRLTLNDYDKIKDKVLERVGALIVEPVRKTKDDAVKKLGEKPKLEDYHRSFKSGDETLTYLAAVVFVAAFLVSLMHIWQFMGTVASSTYHRVDGIANVPLWLWTTGHMVLFVFMAEASMILFEVQHKIQNYENDDDDNVSIFRVLSGSATLFIFIANLSSVNYSASDIGQWIVLVFSVFIAFLPAAFTFGIGRYLERKIVAYRIRVQDAQRQYYRAIDEYDRHMKREMDDYEYTYSQAFEIYETSASTPESHPEYGKLFANALWDAIAKKNPAYADADARLRIAAVKREMFRDEWTNLLDESPDPKALSMHQSEFSTNGHAVVMN